MAGRAAATTDDAGTFTREPEAEGRYTFLTNVELDTPGEHGGKANSIIRHHSSLSLELPIAD